MPHNPGLFANLFSRSRKSTPTKTPSGQTSASKELQPKKRPLNVGEGVLSDPAFIKDFKETMLAVRKSMPKSSNLADEIIISINYIPLERRLDLSRVIELINSAPATEEQLKKTTDHNQETVSTKDLIANGGKKLKELFAGKVTDEQVDRIIHVVTHGKEANASRNVELKHRYTPPRVTTTSFSP